MNFEEFRQLKINNYQQTSRATLSQYDTDIVNIGHDV